MSNDKTADLDWDFGVVDYPIQVVRPDGSIIKPTQYKAVCHETKPVVFYVGSDKYLPIPHRDLLQPVIDKLDQQMFSLNVLTTHQGGRMYATIMHKNATSVPAVGDIKYGVKIVNSLDGTRRLEIHTALMRVICSNGMVATRILGGIKRRHLMSAQLDAGAFTELVNTQLRNTEIVTNLTKLLKPIDRDMFEQVLRHVELPEKYNKKAREVWDMPEVTSITPIERDTAWGAYNVISYVLTHETAKMGMDRQHDFSVALDRAIASVVA